ncbi:MAG TPA: hypothetical protein VK896_02055, partial [Gaiellaceae bacterium]|nr:hypothetical protein [Gaiellaceae bacterium]
MSAATLTALGLAALALLATVRRNRELQGRPGNVPVSVRLPDRRRRLVTFALASGGSIAFA